SIRVGKSSCTSRTLDRRASSIPECLPNYIVRLPRYRCLHGLLMEGLEHHAEMKFGVCSGKKNGGKDDPLHPFIMFLSRYSKRGLFGRKPNCRPVPGLRGQIRGGENASGRSHFQKGFCKRNVNCYWKMI